LHPFDDGYLRRLATGDPDVERHFVAYFGELIRIKVRTRLRQPQMVEDVCQETFLRVLRTLRKPGGLRHAERLGAYVNTVCTNVLLELFRAQSKHPQAPDDIDDPTDPQPDAESGLLAEERQRDVRRVIDELPERDRRLLRAIFIEERDKDDVCAELGINREYLRVMLHRAKRHFKQRYGVAYGEDLVPVAVETKGGSKSPF